MYLEENPEKKSDNFIPPAEDIIRLPLTIIFTEPGTRLPDEAEKLIEKECLR